MGYIHGGGSIINSRQAKEVHTKALLQSIMRKRSTIFPLCAVSSRHNPNRKRLGSVNLSFLGYF